MKITPQPRRALIVVDVQNDFCEGGSLAVAGGSAVAAAITQHLAANPGMYALVVASRDWHTGNHPNGGHFPPPGEDPDYRDTWPVHCVADTPGADYHPDLELPPGSLHVFKGQGAPAYSAFQGVDLEGRSLEELLQAAGVVRVDVVGLATDYCVKATALDAAGKYHTRVLTDLAAGVAPESTTAAYLELAKAGVVCVRSGEQAIKNERVTVREMS